MLVYQNYALKQQKVGTSTVTRLKKRQTSHNNNSTILLSFGRFCFVVCLFGFLGLTVVKTGNKMLVMIQQTENKTILLLALNCSCTKAFL